MRVVAQEILTFPRSKLLFIKSDYAEISLSFFVLNLVFFALNRNSVFPLFSLLGITP